MGAPEPAAVRPSGARHPLVERVLDPGAPDTIRLAAARGVLPIPVRDLLYLQTRLLDDALPAVVGAASESLARVTVETLRPLLTDPGCDPLLLDHFARSERLSGEDLAPAIAHPAIPDATLEELAAGPSTETLRLIVTNEVRVIGNPRLFQQLRNNPNLPADSRRRLLELEIDFIGKEPVVVPKKVEAPPVGIPSEGPGDAGLEGVAEPDEALDAGALSEEPPASETLPEALPDEDLPPEHVAAFQRIMKMAVPERVALAMKGSTEERAILVRDSTKMVSLQVLKNPRLSEGEISGFAAMRNLNEDVLRKIAGNREWTKSYGVIHALIRNPKTPPGLSLRFLPRVGTRDLKIIGLDKNVPEMVRRLAVTMYQSRTQRSRKPGKRSH